MTRCIAYLFLFCGINVIVAQDVIELKMTVRDFLPSTCLSIEERNFYRVPNPNNIWSECDVYTRQSTTIGDDTFTLQGHPDFERFHKDDESTGIVRDTLDYSHRSGIPKPRYCSDIIAANATSDDKFCGDFRTNQEITSGKDRFDEWYRDTLYINKRSAGTLTLYRLGNSNLFEYSSDNPLYNPEAKANYEATGNLNGVKGYFGPLDNTEQSTNPFTPNMCWPHLGSIEGANDPEKDLYLVHKYWFTTELHTYFQYRGDGETFSFSGDDDVFVYINGSLELDLGGIHPSLDKEIKLNNLKHSDLVPGEIYSLDLFHAERKVVRSNFKVTTTLTEACNVANSDVIDSTTYNATNFVQESNAFKLLGTRIDPTEQVLVLSNAGDTHAWGHAWLKQQINVARGFRVSFTYVVEMGEKYRGDGFTLVLQRNGIIDLAGGSSGNLGLVGIDAGIAFAIDFCTKREDNPEESCADATVFKLLLNGKVIAWDSVNTRVNDGKPHTVVFQYLLRPKWIEIFHDDSLWLRQTDIDVPDAIGGNNTYVGFTAASSDFTSTQKILDMTVTTVNVDPSKTTIAGNSTIVGTPADGTSAADITLLSKDFCGFPIDVGGVGDVVVARLVEEIGSAAEIGGVEDWTIPNEDVRMLLEIDGNDTYFNYSSEPIVIDAEVVDNEDGTYNLLFRSDVAARYTLYVDVEEFPVCYENTIPGEEPICSPFENAVAYEVYVPPPPVTTSSPTIPDTDDDTGLGEETVLALAISGGALSLLSIIFFCLCCRYQREWAAKLGFIDSGKLAKLNEGVVYDDRDLMELQHSYQETLEEINRLKAQDGNNPNRKQEIDELMTQRKDISNMLRDMKRKKQQNESDRKSFGGRFLHSMAKRTSFKPTRISFRSNKGSSQFSLTPSTKDSFDIDV